MHNRSCVQWLFAMKIPLQFCWTRFGTEAAQSIHQILARKEEERQANHGLFLWGIGNAVGPSILELVRRASEPEVIFSPIKSAPREEDVAPPAVVAWTAGSTICGDRYELSKTALVTSRFVPSGPRRSHYALVCYSEQPLHLPTRTATAHATCSSPADDNSPFLRLYSANEFWIPNPGA